MTPSERRAHPKRVCTRRCEGLLRKGTRGTGEKDPRVNSSCEQRNGPVLSQCSHPAAGVVPTQTEHRTGRWTPSSMDPADRNIARQTIYTGGKYGFTSRQDHPGVSSRRRIFRDEQGVHRAWVARRRRHWRRRSTRCTASWCGRRTTLPTRTCRARSLS